MASETLALLKVALPKALRAVREDLRRDRGAAYGLAEPWVLPKLGGDLPKLGLFPPDFHDSRIFLADGFVTVLPFPCLAAECDGCTLAPDTWGELKLWVGALFHDRWYLSMEAMAKAWGWPVEKVRKLGDIGCASVLRALARELRGASRWRGLFSSWLYYTSVRAFGGVAHAGYKRLQTTERTEHTDGGPSPRAAAPSVLAVCSVVLLSACVAGCAGCAAPEAFDDPAALTLPGGVAMTNSVTGEHF